LVVQDICKPAWLDGVVRERATQVDTEKWGEIAGSDRDAVTRSRVGGGAVSIGCTIDRDFSIGNGSNRRVAERVSNLTNTPFEALWARAEADRDLDWLGASGNWPLSFNVLVWNSTG
jgi:hypothetical protein